jgi:amidase/aspartyl-tRNA(Asn)/glutamyl-tRNA(Gln) amidotransferase subunit A
MTAHDLAAFSAGSLAEAYARRRLSPVEVLEATLAHAEAVNPIVNALFSIRPEEARAAARASEARWRAGTPLGPLDGVPTTVKDSVAMTGWPYHHGIGANRDAPASTFDSPPAARLKEGGAVVFAKTAMPDGGLLASGVSSLFGVTRNPWGLAFNTGGSSSGAGASLACGLGCVSVGSDIAGSVRLPASHCGLAALKPTQGRIAHLSSDIMRSAGPMGRTIGDIAAMLTVIGQPDVRDAWCLPGEGVAYESRLDRDLKGVRIGVLTDMGFGPKAEVEVLAVVEAAGRALAEAGAVVEPMLALVDHDAYAPIDRVLQVRGLAEYRALPQHGPDDFSSTVLSWCRPAEGYTALDYGAALQEIARIRARVIAAFDGLDYVISPTLPMVNFAAEAPCVDEAVPLGHATFTALFNQTGQPATSVCFGFDARRLPIGVQVVGHRFDDLGVLQVSRALERARPVAMDWPVAPRH